jgi:hypothetical protein
MKMKIKMKPYNQLWIIDKNESKVVSVNFKFIEKKNSEDLLICFTGQGRVVLYDFYNTFTSKDLCKKMDVLFFSDELKGFYLGGVSGYSASFEDTIEKINQLILNKKYKNIYIVGTSMGGYGALLHGFTLNTKNLKSINILVFNPYTYLTEKDFKKRCDFINREHLFYCAQRGVKKKAAKILLTGWDKKYYEIENFIKADPKIKITVIHGHLNEEIKRIEKIKKINNLVLKKFTCLQHNIALFLKENRQLKILLEDYFNGTLKKYKFEIID